MILKFPGREGWREADTRTPATSLSRSLARAKLVSAAAKPVMRTPAGERPARSVPRARARGKKPFRHGGQRQ